MTKTFLDCLNEGGVKGKFFWRREKCYETKEIIYQVKILDRTNLIDIVKYFLEKGEVSRENYDSDYLEEDIEATLEEIGAIPSELRELAEKTQRSKEPPYYPF